MKRRSALVAAGVGVLALVGGQAFGNPTGSVADGVQQIVVVRDDGYFPTDSQEWVDLTNAKAQISGGAGNQLILARFSGESLCTGSGFCSIRIMAQGQELEPIAGNKFAFDMPPVGSTASSSGGPGGGASSSPSGSQHFSAHSIDRSIVRPAGQITVQVQMRVVNGSGHFEIGDWHLTVERAPSKGPTTPAGGGGGPGGGGPGGGGAGGGGQSGGNPNRSGGGGPAQLGD